MEGSHVGVIGSIADGPDNEEEGERKKHYKVDRWSC